MEWTKDRLRNIGIYSSYGLAECVGGLMVYVDYAPQDFERGGHGSAYWFVNRPGYIVDPETRGPFNKSKKFPVWRPREERNTRRDEALAWASARYGIMEWERSPFGSYHPKGTLASLNKERN